MHKIGNYCITLSWTIKYTIYTCILKEGYYFIIITLCLSIFFNSYVNDIYYLLSMCLFTFQSFEFNVNTECDETGNFLIHLATQTGISIIWIIGIWWNMNWQKHMYNGKITNNAGVIVIWKILSK